MISDLQSSDPLVQKITAKLRARLPQASAIIFFGSRVAGCADEFSDYDVMVLLPDGLEEDARDQVKRAMQTAFPKVKLDLLFGSERWLRARLPYEPFYRFWLKESVAAWGQVRIKRFPPLATGAMKSYIGIIGAEIDLAKIAKDRRAASRLGLKSLEVLLEIDHAFKHDYSTRSIKRAVTNLVGDDLVARIRNPKLRLTETDRRKLVRIARAQYRAIKTMLETMPENISDRRWRNQWQNRSRANKSSNLPRNA